MSSLRNAVKRSTHKERAQPSARHRFGLLEKKQDYLKRARNHQKAEDALKVLREKAENRNPDEYYSAMQRGKHYGSDPKAANMTDAEIKGLKGQDMLHVLLQSRKHQKRLKRLQSSLHFIGAPTSNQHTVFVDSPTEARSFSAEEHFDTPPELLSRSFNRPRRAQLEQLPPVTDAASPDRLAVRQSKQRAVAYEQLVHQKETSEKVDGLAMSLLKQRAETAHGRKRPVKSDNGKVVAQQFKRVRQR